MIYKTSAFKVAGLVFIILLASLQAQIDSDSIAEEPSYPWNNQVEAVKNDSEILAEPNPKTVSAPDTLDIKKNEDPIVSTAAKRNTVKGIIISADEKKPLKDVLVVYDYGDHIYTTYSDVAGLFTISNIPPGIYNVKFSKKGYSDFERTSYNVKAMGEIQEILLEKKIIIGSTITVKKPQKSGSKNDQLDKRKASGGVVDGMGAEQIAKGTDSDAGALARRVTGTSVVGGKYVFVRGLGERYTNMTLNGLPVPTPEKDKRVVPQDLFPTSALECFSIYKTFSPDNIPDFAGGSVALVTKGIPEKDFLTIGIGTGFVDFWGDGRFTTLGQKRLTHKSGSPFVTWLGYNDGSRQIPDGVPTQIPKTTEQSEIARYALQFQNPWDTDTSVVYPNHSFKINGGKVWKKESERYGILGGFSHSVKYDQSDEQDVKVSAEAMQRLDGSLAIDTIPGSETRSGEDLSKSIVRMFKVENRDKSTGELSTTSSGLLNFGYENKNHQLWWKNLYANLSELRTNVTRVKSHAESGSTNLDIHENFNLSFESRRILVSQIGGGHYIGKSALDSLSWAAGYGFSKGETPDRMVYQWMKRASFTPIQRDTVINGKSYQAGDRTVDYMSPRFLVGKEYGVRNWDEFTEHAVNGRVDLYWIVPPEWSRLDTIMQRDHWFSHLALPRLQTGMMTTNRNREYNQARYSWADMPIIQDSTKGYDYINEILAPQRVYDTYMERARGFKLSPKDYESYNAEESSIAYYFNSDMGFRLWSIPVQILGGMRFEHYSKDVNIPYGGSDLDPSIPEEAELIQEKMIKVKDDEFDYYPSAGLNFEFIKDTKLRFHYARTMVRPELRELVPNRFFDTENGYFVDGVPGLKNVMIQHYDIRFDYFMPYDQLSSVSFFYKNFNDPIEIYIDAVRSPNIMTFQNADRGFVRGVEMEIDLKVDRIVAIFGWPSLWARDLSLYANCALITSGVELDPSSPGSEELTNWERPMIGQSPWLYNLKLTHELEFAKTEMTNAFLFNVSGPRIKSLGVSGVGDVYEEPFYSLDYLNKWKIGKHSLGLTIKNLLLSDKVLRIDEVNKTKKYYTLSNSERDEIYKDVPSKVIIKDEVGISVSMSWEYSF
jgi:outer membrane receptor protein involved in Fe transport